MAAPAAQSTSAAVTAAPVTASVIVKEDVLVIVTVNCRLARAGAFRPPFGQVKITWSPVDHETACESCTVALLEPLPVIDVRGTEELTSSSPLNHTRRMVLVNSSSDG
jgi:hypothetical protein